MLKRLECYGSVEKRLASKPLVSGRVAKQGTKPKVRKLYAPFIKVEDHSRCYKPLVHELKEWPKIYFDGPLGSCPFDSPKNNVDNHHGEHNRMKRYICYFILFNILIHINFLLYFSTVVCTSFCLSDMIKINFPKKCCVKNIYVQNPWDFNFTINSLFLFFEGNQFEKTRTKRKDIASAVAFIMKTWTWWEISKKLNKIIKIYRNSKTVLNMILFCTMSDNWSPKMFSLTAILICAYMCNICGSGRCLISYCRSHSSW